MAKFECLNTANKPDCENWIVRSIVWNLPVMKKRILVVDSDTAELQQLRNFLAVLPQGWDAVFFETAAAALGDLAVTPSDVIITDFRLSDKTGLELLNEAAKLCPKIGTIVLANLESTDSALKCVGTAHHFVAKPCKESRIRAALDCAFDANAWLPDINVRKLARDMKVLPSPPGLYFRIVKEMQNIDHAMENVGWLIARDPACTARLLQLANSSSFGLTLKVTNPIEAVMYVGLKMTQSIVLLVNSLSFAEKKPELKASVERVWKHSVQTSGFAKVIARSERLSSSVAEEAYTAGLLHDIGQLVLAANYPDNFSAALKLAAEKKMILAEAETQVFGTSHAELGAYLLATWGLPWSIVEAVALHHNPGPAACQKFSSLTVLHVANAMAHETAHDPVSALNMDYIKNIGMEDHLPAWRDLCVNFGESD